MNGRRLLAHFALSWFVIRLVAQIPVPFTSNEDRFMVFAGKRFEKLEPRPPSEVYAMDGQLVYRDHGGQLKIFIPEGRRLLLLERSGAAEVQATRSRIAWKANDTLKTVRDGRVMVLADHVGRFTVSDSLIVFHDTELDQLTALWKGRRIPLADMERRSEARQWVQGSNAALFFEKSTRRLFLFQHGTLSVVCDSTDAGIAAAGGDIVGFWDGQLQRFMARWKGKDHFISDLRPAAVRSGAGIMGFVDGNGRLKCFANGTVHTVLDADPGGWWVQDSLMLYLDHGKLMLFATEGSIIVEPYVPERWRVDGGTLAYLDINRELRGISARKRIRYGTEANISTFELYGKAVVYPSPLGNMVVVAKRRVHTF